MKGKRPPRSFYEDDALEVAPRLLNKVLVAGDCAGRIVEVEAYMGALDPASHGYRGPTPRNAIMFGPPGFLYVYFTYGMHFCCNVVCADEDVCSAVLIRALEPVSGIDMMRVRRPRAKNDYELTNGPAKLCQALDIARVQNGANLLTADMGITILDDGVSPPAKPGTSPRIGIKEGRELPWRYFLENNLYVSRRP